MGSSPLRELESIARATTRDRILIAARGGEGGGMGEAPDKIAALIDTARALDAIGAPHALIGGVAVGIHSGVPRATMERAASDPARRRSKALRDRADVELVRGDVPDPDEGW